MGKAPRNSQHHPLPVPSLPGAQGEVSLWPPLTCLVPCCPRKPSLVDCTFCPHQHLEIVLHY